MASRTEYRLYGKNTKIQSDFWGRFVGAQVTDSGGWKHSGKKDQWVWISLKVKSTANRLDMGVKEREKSRWSSSNWNDGAVMKDGQDLQSRCLV
jgi:hypothetical protein